VETIYSLSGDVPVADAGAESDEDVALWPGALTSGSVRRGCSIRKLSAGGAILHCDHEVAVGERLELELMNGEHLAGRVVWRRGSEVGLSFDAQIDVFAIIAQDIVSQPGERRRMPRVEIVCPELMRALAVLQGAPFVDDVSAFGQALHVRVRDLPPETADASDFGSGGMDTNDVYQVTFTSPGEHTYFCALHPYMKGKIIVVPAADKGTKS